MIKFRSLLCGAMVVAGLMPASLSAQVLLCPKAPSADIQPGDVPVEAERLLKRLTIALDLHGHRGIDEQAILRAHAETPNALLAKFTDIAGQCERVGDDPDEFHAQLPALRKAFLDAAGINGRVEPAERDPRIQNASNDMTEAERVEESIELSIRELWRKLWFRPAEDDDQGENRWAVIVASPEDADSGWDKLGELQRQWKDTYFQLHEPYYASNPHHAIVVGRRLPQEQAERLREYVIELGMARDAYIWGLPQAGEAPSPKKAVAGIGEGVEAGQETAGPIELDLSVLKD